VKYFICGDEWVKQVAKSQKILYDRDMITADYYHKVVQIIS